MVRKTIGFFGGSYCSDKSNEFSTKHNFKTYIERLEEHYNFDTVHLGVPGSSIWDVWLLQFLPLIDTNNLPDICVFIWTDYYRLFHPVVRNIGPATISAFRSDDYRIKTLWKAASQYYQHLTFEDQKIIEYKSALYYFDNVILKSIPSTTKVIHLWGFGDDITNTNTYLHDWKTGVEIRPDLIKVSLLSGTMQDCLFDHANHLNDSFKNDVVFEWIKDAIDNYTCKCVSHDLSKYKRGIN